MADFMAPKQRSNCMSRVRGKNTVPERTLRKRLWAEGFRFRLHSKLPGKPDIVLPKYKTIIFVHGCFWHHHEGCSKSKLPSTREQFWSDKIATNVEHDKRNIVELKRLGSRIVVVWECEIKKDVGAVAQQIIDNIEKIPPCLNA
jgi:DNA mismatch endonuclease, patch repair protein